MTRNTTLTHEFVDYIPDDLKDGTVYVCIQFATVIHKCCCGCGREVVTPLSPTDWRLIFDGQSISLDPSIGNWSFPCRSHYWIKRNSVQWAPQWTQSKIEAGRYQDRLAKQRHFDNTQPTVVDQTKATAVKLKDSLWSKLKRWLT